MSRDKKLYNLIEQQDNKSKQENWAKIQSKLEESDGESGDVENGGNTRSVIFSKKAILYSICAAVLLAAVILLIVFVPRKPDGGGNGLDGFTGSAEEYSTVSTNYTLKDYAAQTGNNILYFDWYDQTEYEDNIVKSNVTGRIICYNETIYDMDTGYTITFNITNPATKIDSLSKYDSCSNTTSIKEIEIKWTNDSSLYFSTFEHKGFKYYMEIPDCDSPEILLGYIEQLLA
ncbi:MAG: hypothetical protein K2H78_03715 [Clostridia bacterium]|nr:hypothetical protein [Clostridia bacterium]